MNKAKNMALSIFTKIMRSNFCSRLRSHNFFSHSQIKLTEKSICAIRECRAGDKNVNYVVVDRLELINERVSCARQPNKQSAEFQIRHTLARFWCANARTYHMCVRAPPLANFAIFVCASRVC
jgi:hypothetical protein